MSDEDVLSAQNCNITLANPIAELRWTWVEGKKTLQQAWRVERHRVGQPTILEIDWRAIPEVSGT